MNKDLILKDSVNKAAIGYSERLARHQNLPRIQCPSLEFGIQTLCQELIENGLIDTEELFDFLMERSYRDYDKIQDCWWQ